MIEVKRIEVMTKSLINAKEQSLLANKASVGQ